MREKIIAKGSSKRDFVSHLEEEYKASLEEELEDSRKKIKTVITPFMADNGVFYKQCGGEMLDAYDNPLLRRKKLTEICGNNYSTTQG